VLRLVNALEKLRPCVDLLTRGNMPGQRADRRRVDNGRRRAAAASDRGLLPIAGRIAFEEISGAAWNHIPAIHGVWMTGGIGTWFF